MTNLDHTDTPASVDYATIYLAFELSKAKWMLGVILPGSKKLSRHTITGGDVAALAARLAEWRRKAALCGKPVRILSCYEAGFDGHWLHRWLTDQGVINHEIDPSSIEVNRRARRAKTDRIDLERMMRAFLELLRGEPEACHVVHVPSVEDEDRKRRSRARERLLKEVAPALGSSPESLELRDGKVRVRGGGRTMTLAEAASRLKTAVISAQASRSDNYKGTGGESWGA